MQYVLIVTFDLALLDSRLFCVCYYQHDVFKMSLILFVLVFKEQMGLASDPKSIAWHM